MPTATAAAPSPVLKGGLRPRLRAFRAEDLEAQVERRMEALRLAAPGAADITRSLRLARKAARSRQPGREAYDPARHAALLRLARSPAQKRARERQALEQRALTQGAREPARATGER